MVSSDQRRRQLAREKFERQQQRREEARHRTRRLTAIIASALAVVTIIGTGAFFALGSGAGDDGTADAAASATPSASPPPSKSAAPEPAMKIDKTAKYSMSLKTSQGDIAIEMDAAKTPHTTNSFKALADKGFFDGTKCHRLTTQNIYVLQCGDPKGDGTGGPGYTIPDENLTALGKAGADGTVTFPAGTVAMANTGQPGSGGSQFFLVYKDTQLPPTYTPFGTMDAKGLTAVKKIAEAGAEGGAPDGAPKKAVAVEKVTVDKA